VYPLRADHWHAATSADGLEKRRDEPPHHVFSGGESGDELEAVNVVDVDI
jgi:hypothetical protein